MPTIIKTFTSSQGGVKNYLSTRSSSFSGWTNVGTGATGSTTTTAAELPELSVGTALKVTNGGSGSGYVESDFFQVDASDLGKLLGLTYNLETSTSPAYAASDLQIQVWDATTSGGTYAQNTTLNVANVPSSPTGGTMQLSFSQNPSRPFTRIRIVRVAGLANSWASFSSITVTSATGGQSAAVTYLGTYVPVLTSSGATNLGLNASRNTLDLWRVGDVLKVQGTIQKDGNSPGGTTSNPIYISLPTGLTSAKAATVDFKYGTYSRYVSAYEEESPIVNVAGGGIGFANPTTTSVRTAGAFAANAYVYIDMEVPIAEWAGSGTVNLGPGAQVEYAFNSSTTTSTDTTSFGYGPQGVLFQAFAPAGTASVDKRVRFQYPIQADDMIQLEVDEGTGGARWVPIESRLSTYGLDAATPTLAYGTLISFVDASTIDIRFFSRISLQTTATWSGIASSNWRWRVRKAKASSPVGYGKSNSNEFGLVAPRRGQQSLTVTSSVAFTSYRAVGIYYQDQDGNHRLKFNIVGAVAGGARTGTTLTITGVTFKNASGYNQSVAGHTDSAAVYARVTANANTITVAHASATTTEYGCSGDVELESRPSWA
jgi:hypothetical protein